ncbi:SUMF1/EgtB/PvdO family nonheme iron enzyme [Breznakiellaceae bacterium SP9]
MRKFILVCTAFLLLAFQLTAQAKPRLAILPFSGGDGTEGETIAELVSLEPALTAAFIPVSRTRITATIRNENPFRMGTAWTNPDMVGVLGKQLGAQYVLTGHIAALGNNKLLVISIMEVEHLQEVTGDLQTYRNIEEIPAKLPAMVQTIVNAATVDTAKLPKLAVVPVQLQGGQTKEEADVLAHILSLYVVRSGTYAGYPRASSLEQVKKEYEEQMAVDSPRYVLSTIAHKLGTLNVFNASVIDLESGDQIHGGSASYSTLDDGITAMASLTNTLTGIKIAALGALAQSTDTPMGSRNAGPLPAPTGTALSASFNMTSQVAATPQKSIASDMVRIQGGTFMMGSPASEPSRESDEVQHRVSVSSFSIGKTEVTQKDYQAVMGNNPSSFKGDTLPVETVTWYEAVAYCNARSRQEGLTPAYTIIGTNVSWDRSANGYRLPTEAEWEYACRAGTTTPFSTGSNINTNQANYDGNYPYNGNSKGTYRQATTAVGSFAPNSWGLYDMPGNVWEWCWDWYGDYSSSPQTDPIGAASESYRVGRGGSWYYDAASLRSAGRYYGTPTYRSDYLGFRVVRP